MTEAEFRSANRRYGDLVDRWAEAKWCGGKPLTAAEEDEMERLRQEIDEHFAPFYNEVERRIEEMETRAHKALERDHENQQ